MQRAASPVQLLLEPEEDSAGALDRIFAQVDLPKQATVILPPPFEEEVCRLGFKNCPICLTGRFKR